MIKISATRNVIDCIRVAHSVSGAKTPSKSEFRNSRVVMKTRAGHIAVYGRFLATTLHLAAAAASRIGARADLKETTGEAQELLRRAWAEQTELRTNEELNEDWCGVFVDGVLVYTENCPNEIVFIESIASGAEFTAALLQKAEAEYARMGRNTGLKMLTEKAMDLQTVGGQIDCCVVTRTAKGRKPVRFTFNHRKLEDSILSALRTAADIIDASVLAGRQARMPEADRDQAAPAHLENDLQVMTTRLRQSQARVQKASQAKDMRFSPKSLDFLAHA
ncbi:MAG: hypothetical protein AAF220_06855 [Pseudomonadota bacterium]